LQKTGYVDELKEAGIILEILFVGVPDSEEEFLE
jgi:hypothetical protein